MREEKSAEANNTADLSYRDLANPFNHSYFFWPHHMAANSTPQWCTGLMLLPDKKEQKFQYFPYITCCFAVHHLSFRNYKNILKLILYYHNTEYTDAVRGDLHPQRQISACLGVKPAHREIKTKKNGPTHDEQ